MSDSQIGLSTAAKRVNEPVNQLKNCRNGDGRASENESDCEDDENTTDGRAEHLHDFVLTSQRLANATDDKAECEKHCGRARPMLVNTVPALLLKMVSNIL